MNDIVERLRSFHGGPPLWAETMHEAAAEIKRLRALQRIDKYEPALSDPHPEWTRQRQRDALIEQQAAKIERLRALGPEDDWEERGAAAKMQAEIERLQGELQTVHAHLQHYRILVDGLRAALRAIEGGNEHWSRAIARAALEGK